MLPRPFSRILLAPAAAIVAAAATTTAMADDGGIPTHDYKAPAVVSLATTLIGTDGKPLANVQLHQDAAGTVLIILDATKLPAGPHGIHIHAVGSCEGPAFASAGGHYNPSAQKHGLNSADGAHGGDLPQIDDATVSQGYYTATTKAVSMTGGANTLADADGSALMVHAAADDQVTDPTGNSGGRIACAVIAAPKAGAAPAVASPASTPRPPATGSGVLAENSSRWDLQRSALAALAGVAVGSLALYAARRRA